MVLYFILRLIARRFISKTKAENQENGDLQDYISFNNLFVGFVECNKFFTQGKIQIFFFYYKCSFGNLKKMLKKIWSAEVSNTRFFFKDGFHLTLTRGN